MSEGINSIRFQNVSFTYIDRTQKAIDNVSFEIKKGEKVLILGHTGSGKTTIINLICGLLIPDEGDIFINDIPIQNIDQITFKKLLGLVPQEPSLFSGTIKENVLFGVDEQTPLPHYEPMISAVQMKEEIDLFTEKDLTKIGQKGLTLSGGQKQRLAIARALYKKPQLLIFDDITASLDAKKEELLWQDIMNILNDITAIVVSHRLSSLRYADSVLLLEKGKIVASGKHDDLLKNHKIYKDFIKYGYG